MPLTVDECLQHIKHTLGSEMSPELQPVTILNQAGRFLVSLHDWTWLLRPPYHLGFQGPLTFTNATVEQDAAQITIPGASDYPTAVGGKVTLDSTGGVLPGDYYVTWQDGTTLGLNGVPNPSPNPGVFNGHGTLTVNAIPLPADFRKAIAIVPMHNLVSRFAWLDMQSMMKMRANNITTGNLLYYGAISWQSNRGTNYGQPSPRLDIYPTPTADADDVLMLEYMAGWSEISDDSAVIGVPDYLDSVYIQLIRAFARGYEEEDSGTMDQRLALIARGPLMKAALDRDGEVQGNLGQMQGGIAMHPALTGIYFTDTPVGGPL